LSGLVIDKFDDLIVIEFFSSGMFKFRDVIFRCLNEYNTDARFYWFAEEHVQKQESFDCHAPKSPGDRVITENRLSFKVSPESKHKTGFFNDQRENRLKLSKLVLGKRVLDLCCNSGGFSIYAKAKGGASEVTAVDLDEDILKLAEENAKLNQAKIRFVHADIFNWLRVAHENKQDFDVVILDPSKQTRNREEVDKALRRYTDMNRLAMQVVKPGGVLLTCSCTGLVSEDEFIESIKRAAWQAGRTAQVFEVTGAGDDHPFLAHVQESRYLKAVWCRII
jgi:23S rRNA (cytosine1962-C5)-methyltransferase